MPRAKYAGDATVDMLINTETDDTILDHWPLVLPWIVSAAFCCDFILFSNTEIIGWGPVAERCNTPHWRQIADRSSSSSIVLCESHIEARLTKSLNSVQIDAIHELALSPRGQLRLAKLDGTEPGIPSHRYHLDQLISLE